MTKTTDPGVGRPGRLAGVLSTLALVAGLAGWVLFLRPTSLGGPATWVIVSGASMEPGLSTGDLVIARRDDSYTAGDVVAFRVPDSEPGAGATVIHRIRSGSGTTGFVTQGDNRSSVDLWRPLTGDVQGRQWLHIPRLGALITVLASPVGVGAAAALLVFLYVITGGPPGPPPGGDPRARRGGRAPSWCGPPSAPRRARSGGR